MNRKVILTLAAVSLSIVGLSGCASTPPAAESGPSSEGTGAELAVADSTLGEIVVDGEGMTVYVFDKDTADSGKSACSGECLAAWPPVETTNDSPTADGITGEVATITRDDGSLQITLNGLPLYLYSPDEAAGEVTGQGVSGVWWVVGPDGDKIDTVADSGY